MPKRFETQDQITINKMTMSRRNKKVKVTLPKLTILEKDIT